MPEPDRTIIAHLAALREQVFMAEEEATERRREYAKAMTKAREKGWSTRKLAAELDVSPGRIQQIIAWGKRPASKRVKGAIR